MAIDIRLVKEAEEKLKDVVSVTPLKFCKRLSEQFNAKIYFKREDLQDVRSFKIRGAFNKISSLSSKERKKGVVCASAGNHAQGVAYSCAFLKIKGVIFMPSITPNQKIERVRHFGGKFIEIKLVGNTFDEANEAAINYCEKKKAAYVHPFNDPLTIAGQGTVGKEIFDQIGDKVDFVLCGIGGGGLISGISSYLKHQNPKIKIYGAEPKGAAAMCKSLQQGVLVALERIDPFVDGAAVKKVGDLTFKITKNLVDNVIEVEEGKVCMSMIDLYQNEGIIVEPAGALGVAALDDIASKIKGKTVVVVLSGGNNDILRYPEIMEKSLIYQGRKHYFILQFSQKPGQLRQFVDKALGPRDDIVRFEYIKKTNKEKGAALVGIELTDKKDLKPLLKRMQTIGINFKVLTKDQLLYDYLI